MNVDGFWVPSPEGKKEDALVVVVVDVKRGGGTLINKYVGKIENTCRSSSKKWLRSVLEWRSEKRDNCILSTFWRRRRKGFGGAKKRAARS